MKCILLILFTTSVFAYVPTVESLFRHGPNPEVSANGVSLSLKILKINQGNSDAQEENVSGTNNNLEEEYYKLYFTKTKETMKLSQTIYDNHEFSEKSLINKTYYPNLSPLIFKGNSDEIEKSLFMGLIISLIFNEGDFLIKYLKTINVPVKLNSEIINKEKVELLAAYKRYLVLIGQNRLAKKTEMNPLMPQDQVEKERISALMNESMYVDQKQVNLNKNDGNLAWQVIAGNFEAAISYSDRRIQRIKLQSISSDVEIYCKDYWLANGTHSLPKYIIIKDLKGESFQVEILNLKHFIDREEDLINRHKKWDQLLKGKESLRPRHSFML